MIRTLRLRLQRYFTYKSTSKWYDTLQDLENTINSTVSRAHGLPPNAVSKENEAMVYERLYKPLPRKTAPQFRVNDRVRISVQKIIFAKEAQQSFSSEIFIVDKVILGRPTVYALKDLKGEEIQGIFYSFELVKVDGQGPSKLMYKIGAGLLSRVVSLGADPPRSFYVTINSETDSSTFPTNRPATFSNKCNFDFTCTGEEEQQQWECAITHLFCTPIQVRNLFEHEDDLIIVNSRLPTRTLVLPANPPTGPRDPILGWSLAKLWTNHFKSINEGISLAYYTDRGFEFKISDPKIVEVNLPEADFGFHSLRPLRFGLTRSDFLPSDELRSLSPQITLTLKARKYLELKLSPIVVKDPSDLYTHLNTLFQEAELDVVVEGREEMCEIKFGLKADLTLQFPEGINRIFNFEHGHVIDSANGSLDVEKVNLRGGNDIYVIASNVVEKHFYCGKRVGILRQVLQPSPGQVQELNFQPLLYVPVSRDHFTSLNLYIMNESDEYVSFGESPVSATLHFRLCSIH